MAFSFISKWELWIILEYFCLGAPWFKSLSQTLPQDPRQPTQVLSALSCPPLGIWCQLCHGTSGFHCLTSASVAPFKCRSWKASPTGKAPALYNSFHPTAKYLCWAFDYIVLSVSPSYCLHSSFFHSTALERLPRNSWQHKMGRKWNRLHSPGFLRTAT